MSDAIDRAAKAMWSAIDDKGIEGRLTRQDCDYIVKALAEAGLLAPAPLREEWVAGGEALTPHAQFDTINTKHPQAKALEHFRSLVATIGEHTVPEARVCHDLVNLSQVVGLLDRQIAAIYANQPGFLVDTMIRPEGDGRAVR